MTTKYTESIQDFLALLIKEINDSTGNAHFEKNNLLKEYTACLNTLANLTDVEATILPFKEYLIREYSLHHYRWTFKLFLSLIMQAKLFGVIELKQPGKYLPEYDKTGKVLTLDDLILLVQASDFTEGVFPAYLFSLGSGLRLEDIRNAKRENIKEVKKGVYNLAFVEGHTTVRSMIHVVPELIEMIKWRSNKKGLIFPKLKALSHQVIHNRLKQHAEYAGLRKSMTFLSARRTRKVLAVESNNHWNDISQIIGLYMEKQSHNNK